MIIGREEIKLAYSIVKEEKDYYLDQIRKDNEGVKFEEYEINDFIVLSEIIIPAIENGLKENELDTDTFQKHRVFIMAIEAYVAKHLERLTDYDYGLLVKMKINIEDELNKAFENNIKPEDWHEHEGRILKERERVVNMIKQWHEGRKK